MFVKNCLGRSIATDVFYVGDGETTDMPRQFLQAAKFIGILGYRGQSHWTVWRHTLPERGRKRCEILIPSCVDEAAAVLELTRWNNQMRAAAALKGSNIVQAAEIEQAGIMRSFGRPRNVRDVPVPQAAVAMAA